MDFGKFHIPCKSLTFQESKKIFKFAEHWSQERLNQERKLRDTMAEQVRQVNAKNAELRRELVEREEWRAADQEHAEVFWFFLKFSLLIFQFEFSLQVFKKKIIWLTIFKKEQL